MELGEANTASGDLKDEARVELRDAINAAVIAASASASASDGPSAQTAFSVFIPPPAVADNDRFVTHLTDFINRIYLAAEATFWTPGFIRTDTDQIRDLLRSGGLALAWRSSNDDDHDGDLLTKSTIGCVQVKMLPDQQTGEFGMLAADPASQGLGVGRELMRFAEQEVKRRGGKVMRLELLQGKGWSHELKDRLEKWYGRCGYELIAVEDVEKSWSILVPHLVAPAVMKVFHKQL